ncbi:hypothetical protein AaE_008348 [Aphanomyces astaci]|uniref:Protein kinase domain-containing protein n=1 Tax=Aphanomyces astaci TaxID=112090 RepID=A0A6A5ADP2_APHAT|nr:hypothetical protein AaE_008348 [Aphanomyces astaci]
MKEVDHPNVVRLYEILETAEYILIAMELCEGPVDAWSLGVVLYLMTVGRIPFDGKTTDALYKKVLGGAFDIPSTVSPELRDLMSAILVVDANDRMRVEHIRHHTWLGMENQHVLSSEISSSLFVANAALHSEILAEMDGYGLNRMQLHDDLASKTYNAATTWYLPITHSELTSTRSFAETDPSTALSSVDFTRFLHDRIAKAKTLG